MDFTTSEANCSKTPTFTPMNTTPNYLEINKKTWNEKVPVHADSAFYDMEALSDAAIIKANDLAAELDVDARFICCDVYSLPQVLDEKFDIVFTSYGTIGWLPDMDKWAEVVAHFMKPGGSFVFAEFHPVVWMFDNDLKYVQYPYFKAEPILETESGTYADRENEKQFSSMTWNHGIGEVFMALKKQGLNIEVLKEYDYSPYNCLANMVETGPDEYRVAHLNGLIPLVYALKASKPD
jgi:SAM-dependent methyltransferase